MTEGCYWSFASFLIGAKGPTLSPIPPPGGSEVNLISCIESP